MARKPQGSRPKGSGATGGQSAGSRTPGSRTKDQSKAVRSAQRASSGGRNWGLIAGVLALILFVGGVLGFAFANAGEDSSTAQQDEAIEGLGASEFDVADDASNHVQTPVDYPQTPPVGGPHNGVWQNCGVYDAPVASENAVHSLEHGAVWITYDPSLPADQVQRLDDLAGGQSYVLVSPFDGLTDEAIFASAWGVQIEADSADDPRLGEFLTAYVQGPQTPEPGAVCSGGVGTPVG